MRPRKCVQECGCSVQESTSNTVRKKARPRLHVDCPHVDCPHVASKKARPHSWTHFLARYIFGCYMLVLDVRCFTAPCLLHASLRQPKCLGLSNLSFCLCVCPLVCIYVYVYICVHTYIYVCIHICKCRVYENCRDNNRRDQTSKLRLDLERNRSACLKQLKDHLYLARYLH